MASKRRSDKSENPYLPNVRPSPKYFFLNEELVKVLHVDRGNNMVTLWNPGKQKRQMVLYTDFRRNRRRAYRPSMVAALLNRSTQHIRKLVLDGVIPRAKSIGPGNVHGWQIKSYYSEDDIYLIRSILAQIHRGKPRKDGLITSTMISEEELRVRLGDGMMLFTQDKDGRMIPVWSETL